MVLAEIGTLLELQGANRFKVRAYAGAARALEEADAPLEELIETGALETLSGIGPASRAVVEELAATGASSYHAELRRATPLGLLELLKVSGIGAAKVRTLHDDLGIDSLDALEQAAREGRLTRVKGFGPRVQSAILESIAFVRASAGRRLLSGADRAAARVLEVVRGMEGVIDAEVAGSVRRRDEFHSELVLVAASRDAASVLEAFRALAFLDADADAADADAFMSASGTLADGFRVSLRVASPERYPLAFFDATGSREHVEAVAGHATVAGLELLGPSLRDSAGEDVAVADEAAIYAAAGLPWIPPELREGLGETDLAASGDLPRLLHVDDIRGCFHNHTTWSDGSASVPDMARAAEAMGWRWLGLADHSSAAAYAGGIGPEELAEQREEIEDWNAHHGDALWIFQGVEADILPDGTLDLAETGALDHLDYVVASVHSAFGLDERAQTERVLAAMARPEVTMLGHATGRRLLQREGYRLDLEAVFQAAARLGVAVEINANPRRLDLPWRWWHRARELGVETAVNPDAHATRELANVRFGVDVARKGCLPPDLVWNTLELDAVRERLSRRRAHAASRGRDG